MATLARSKIEKTLLFADTGRVIGPRLEGGGSIAAKIKKNKNIPLFFFKSLIIGKNIANLGKIVALLVLWMVLIFHQHLVHL